MHCKLIIPSYSRVSTTSEASGADFEKSVAYSHLWRYLHLFGFQNRKHSRYVLHDFP